MKFSKIVGMGKERDRITFDLKDLRERLESVSTEPGQSMASVLRWVAMIGVDVLEACRRLRIPPPTVGEAEKWLLEISEPSKRESRRKKLSELITKLNFIDIEESGIPFDRMVAIKRGDQPTPDEVIKLAKILGYTPAEITDLVRDRQSDQ